MTDTTEKLPEGAFKLSDGRVAQMGDFKGKHIRDAHRLAGEETSNFMFALISVTFTIDGKGFPMEDLDLMPGKDVMKMQKAFSEENF